MRCYAQRSRKSKVKQSYVEKTNSEADRQLAVFQKSTLIGFNRKNWPVPQGMTSQVAMYKPRKEILNAAVTLYIRVKYRRYVRLDTKLVKEGNTSVAHSS